MAKQLLDTRSKQAYVGVEKFAAAHPESDSGALAYFVLGYAHALDNDHDKALAAYKKARAHAREINDYLELDMARSYGAKNQPADIIATLDGFTRRHPETLLGQKAAVMLAHAYMQAKEPEHAAEVLQPYRSPARAEVELLIGNALLSSGDTPGAVKCFRRVYYELPLSNEADEAGAQLKKLDTEETPEVREMRHVRADVLTKGKRYWQAVAEYRKLITDNADLHLPAIHVALAHDLYRSDQVAEAKQELLAVTNATGDAAAERLYLLAEIARSEKDDATHEQYLDQIRQLPETGGGWLQETLLSSANMYLLRRDFKNSAALFDELSEKSATPRSAASAHWKAAWLHYRMGDMNEAKKRFEEQIEKYPGSAEVPNAIYWRGRLAEEDGDKDSARAAYAKLAGQFRHFYYADLGRKRLQQLGKGETADVAWLAKVTPLSKGTIFSDDDSNAEDIHLLKAKLLANGALFDLALSELQAVDPSAESLRTIVSVNLDAQRPAQAIEAIKKALPNYAAAELSALPQDLWQALFPRPYWSDLKQSATANGLDPYLVASLIRQESEFNAVAISYAQAYGLMQLLPSVGKTLAKEVKVKHFITNNLLDPAINLKLGTRYFKEMLDENNGKVEYALAAYNAGQHRVVEWTTTNNFRDTDEFVESIPFTQTRDYVQAIMRNVSLYRAIYGAP